MRKLKNCLDAFRLELVYSRKRTFSSTLNTWFILELSCSVLDSIRSLPNLVFNDILLQCNMFYTIE